MSLKDLDIETEYRTLSNDIVREFYNPTLGEAVSYKRAVGFFSSTALSRIGMGLYKLYENSGHIQLIASPKLSEEDMEAMEKGYQRREDIIAHALSRELLDYEDFSTKNRLNILANLIAEGVLDIRIAVHVGKGSIGIYHEKVGIIQDSQGNAIAFSGSMNETGMALGDNYEAVDVFCSWREGDAARVAKKLESFDRIWNNADMAVEVMDFPEIKKQLVDKYRIGDMDSCRKYVREESAEYSIKKKFGFFQPEGVQLYDYQLEAIRSWAEQDYCGIFDMATGTGKTFTALGALAELCSHVDKLAVIIACPYQHLVDQWVEDINKFGVSPIIGYSGIDYKSRLRDKVFNYNHAIEKFFCFITTNASFGTDDVMKHIKKLKGNVVLVVDEAHNFGATKLKEALMNDLDHINYRLALSATLERHEDPEGTAVLHEYFGEKCIEYDLGRAIQEKKLTPYNYYPVIVYLTPEELEKYQAYTLKIAQCMYKKNGRMEITQTGKAYLLKRARLIAAASGKIDVLRELLPEYVHSDSMLFYCGATNIHGIDDVDDEEIRQIDYISQMLNFEYGMHTGQFTSREDAATRKSRIEEFQERELQALVAIKCLDEGVNVPSIKTAFILASTANPKEYIQRRGRVLRLFPGKDHADIYDFVTLPRELSGAGYISGDLANGEKSLIVKEIKRMKEFGRLAINFYDTYKVIDDLCNAYNIADIDGESEEEEYEV